MVAGGIVWTTAYSEGGGRAAVQAELRAGLRVLLEHDIDLILVEVRQLPGGSQLVTIQLLSAFLQHRGDGVGSGAGPELQQARGGHHVHRTPGRREGGARDQ